MILINSEKEIIHMRAAGHLAAELLKYLEQFIVPGVSTGYLNDLAEKWTKSAGARSGPLGYKGFTKSICTSINEVVCHGIPSDSAILNDGDIVNIDVTPVLNGFYGDVSKTYCVGNVSDNRRKLVEVTKSCLDSGISAALPGKSIRDIGRAIQSVAGSSGFSVVRDFVGHGIGRTFHTTPSVFHYDEPNLDIKLLPGMIFTIEPMINAGSYEIEMLNDGWTAVTKDGADSAQFEHTVLITDKGAEVLTI